MDCKLCEIVKLAVHSEKKSNWVSIQRQSPISCKFEDGEKFEKICQCPECSREE